ncbi:MAG: DUF1641 domain-containing protein [Chloroflexi bacterium]|nr:DUF1641 domain-containing protein [Chloroflexota bacterium]
MADVERGAQEVTLERVSEQLAALQQQVAALTQLAEENRRRREQWEDLARDVEPILNDMYMLAVHQLEEASPYVQLEDLVRLGTRLLRSVRVLEQMLMELESLQDLMHDTGPITHDAFQLIVERLDYMDKAGYFPTLRALAQLFDRVMRELSPEDVETLEAGLVALIDALPSLLRPELIQQVTRLARAYEEAVQQPESLDTSTLGLLRRLRDPRVRRGMALGLRLLESLAP